MKITVVGAGNGGSTISADLTLKGHEVTLLKTSDAIHNEHFAQICKSGYAITLVRDGRGRTAKLRLATKDVQSAFQDCELVISYVQTNYHEAIARRIAPFLKDQIVLLEPGYLGTLHFKKYCAGKSLVFVEAESSPIDCRITKPGEVSVIFENVRNPIGIYPKDRRDEVLEKLSVLDYKFMPAKSVIESALHNPNLIVHTVGALLSIPRIEFTDGDYWMYKEVFTPSVWNVVKRLDGEKMDVMEKLGYERLPYVEACKLRNSVDDSRDATEVFFDYARNHSPKGPAVPNSRYLTEDVSEGLVLLESIGMHLKVPMPISSALIDLAGAALGTDFRKKGRTLEKLGVEDFKNLLTHYQE